MKVFKKLIVTVLTLSILIANMQVGNGKVTQAATSSKNLAAQYLNAVDKYLHLGEKSQNSFDFNIKSSAKDKKAKYVWAINKQKGKPDAVSINSKTGVVTAKKIGTAYIYCKITKANGSIIKPEAVVIVRNNVTKIGINSVSNHQTVSTGTELKFNYTIVNTEAGNGEASSDIVKWEIKENISGATVTSDGTVQTGKTGTFQIRAISFQSNSKYNEWLKDKIKNKKYITASSTWYKINVEEDVKEAIVKSQSQLEEALRNKDITLINISTKAATEFNIAKGDYSSKNIFVNAPNADVKNEGVFKSVVIQAIKDSTWIEYAGGNIIYLDDSVSSIIIDKNSAVKEIVIDRPDSIMNIKVEGKVDKISLLQNSQIALTGNDKNIKIAVEELAVGSNISSSVPLEINMKADTTVELSAGAEGTKLNRSDDTVEVYVKNNTRKEVQIYTNNVLEKITKVGDSVNLEKKSGSEGQNRVTPTSKPTETPTKAPETPTNAPDSNVVIPPIIHPEPTPTPSETPTTPPINLDAKLSSFNLGNDSVLSLKGIEISDPSVDAGAYTIISTDSVTGITIIPNNLLTSFEVSVNNNIIDNSKLNTLLVLPGDTIIVKVTTQDKNVNYYKLRTSGKPIANDDTAEVNERESVLIDVLGNDLNKGDDPIIRIQYSPNYGTAIIEGNYIKYTPKSDFFDNIPSTRSPKDVDTITYYFKNGDSFSTRKTITITVKPAKDRPFAIDDTVNIFSDETISFDAIKNDINTNTTDFTYNFFKEPGSNITDLLTLKFNQSSGIVEMYSKWGNSGDTVIQYTITGKGYTAIGYINVHVIPRTSEVTIKPNTSLEYTVYREGYYNFKINNLITSGVVKLNLINSNKNIIASATNSDNYQYIPVNIRKKLTPGTYSLSYETMSGSGSGSETLQIVCE